MKQNLKFVKQKNLVTLSARLHNIFWMCFYLNIYGAIRIDKIIHACFLNSNTKKTDMPDYKWLWGVTTSDCELDYDSLEVTTSQITSNYKSKIKLKLKLRVKIIFTSRTQGRI